MTTLVTGAAGFLGRHLADCLREIDGVPAIGADLRAPTESGYASFHVVDFRDSGAVRSLVRRLRPARVVHLIGGAAGDDATLEELNVGSARRLLAALEIEGIPASTVLLGSAAEYGAVPVVLQPVREEHAGTPTTPYGRIKGAVTRLAQDARDRGQNVTVARPFNVIGPGVPPSLVCGALINRIRDAMRTGDPRRIAVGRTDGIRDFVAVQDVARGLALLAQFQAAALAYNLCTGEGHSVQDLLDRLLTLARVEIDIERDVGLLRNGDVDQMLGDPSRARADLGWSPSISYTDAIEQSWRWATRGDDPR
jgi:GDP-4-dehydro-6-deoxy-D-mannose reductase